MIKKIAMIFILLFVCNVSFSHAEQTESKSSAQKQKGSRKEKVLKIKPGDVYPGDAAVAGYDEIVIHKVKDTVAGRTYIFSNVEDSYGYFRVLEYYGYGREEENKRDHLIYAERTLLPKTLSTDPLFKNRTP